MKNILSTIGIALLCTMAACKSSKMELVEPRKDITGTWQIKTVSQNGLDIGTYANPGDFRITFNSDNSYSLTGQYPFMVYAGGTWAFNDPQYPFSMTMTPSDTNQPISSQLAFPIVGTGYELGLDFVVAGCGGDFQNTYHYVLKKVN